MKPTIRKILVPTDFSDLSVEAIRYAMSLAEVYESELHLLHVVDDAPVLALHTMEMTTDFVIEDTTRTAEQHLQAFARTHDIHGREGVTLAVRHGNPYDEITRYATEEQVDMIVMATHGRTGLAHALLGSVAEKVVQHADIPVLTIKPAQIRADRPAAQAAHQAPQPGQRAPQVPMSSLQGLEMGIFVEIPCRKFSILLIAHESPFITGRN